MSSVPSAFDTTRTSGWVVFAGVMITVTGGLNAVDGFVGLYRTGYFRNNFVFGNLREWAWAFLIFGGLQIATGLAILARQGWARWVGIAMVTVNAFAQLFVIDSYPIYAAIIIAYDIAVFYALSVRWQRRVPST
jgi:hypothetical protein